jgi:hypothetical protein
MLLTAVMTFVVIGALCVSVLLLTVFAFALHDWLEGMRHRPGTARHIDRAETVSVAHHQREVA